MISSNDLLILIIGLLVLLLIVVLIAASRSKPGKKPGPSLYDSGGGGTAGSGGYIDGKTIDSTETYPGGNIGGYEEDPGGVPGGSYREDEADSEEPGHDVDRIFIAQVRTNVVICPNCDTENIRGESRCIACDYPL